MNRFVEIRIIVDDDGVLPAQFERATDQSTTGSFGEIASPESLGASPSARSDCSRLTNVMPS